MPHRRDPTAPAPAPGQGKCVSRASRWPAPARSSFPSAVAASQPVGARAALCAIAARMSAGELTAEEADTACAVVEATARVPKLASLDERPRDLSGRPCCDVASPPPSHDRRRQRASVRRPAPLSPQIGFTGGLRARSGSRSGGSIRMFSAEAEIHLIHVGSMLRFSGTAMGAISYHLAAGALAPSPDGLPALCSSARPTARIHKRACRPGSREAGSWGFAPEPHRCSRRSQDLPVVSLDPAPASRHA